MQPKQPKDKPKLRRAPTPGAMSAQQDAVAKLLALESWTEEPSNPAAFIAPVEAPKPLKAVTPREAPKVAPVVPPEAPLKPWEIASADATHPYHVILPERLFQKLDTVWKRRGYKSMRDLTVATLLEMCDRELKALGEIL